MQKSLRKKMEMHRKSSTNGAGNEGQVFCWRSSLDMFVPQGYREQKTASSNGEGRHKQLAADDQGLLWFDLSARRGGRSMCRTIKNKPQKDFLLRLVRH
jgi:hypothetical protein